MSVFSYVPFRNTESLEVSEDSFSEASIRLPIKARAIKPTNVFTSFFGNAYKYKDRADFEEAPYDFERIAKAVDTDSYAKQAFGKYKDLTWKEGWTISGRNEQAVDYLWRRLDVMEKAMNRSFQDFMTEAVDQLYKYHNVFIAIARANVSDFIPEMKRIPDEERGKAIAGFYIIPTEKVLIKRDKYNKPKQYAQRLTSDTKGADLKNKDNLVTWKADDVLHLYLDRKPGRAFGTPFITPVLNDIISLRQLEEDILNLTHRELFPLYLYKVGNDSIPAKEGEVDNAVESIEALRAEGGLVMPGNHDVKVIGSEGHSLEVNNYLNHFKERVAIGLGVSSHHLGMMGAGSNRSVTERLDLAFYDKVKNYQAYIEDVVRLHIFNPLLEEVGFDASASVNTKDEDSDACYFEFNEIDIDTQIKKENHFVDLFNKNAITLEELREKLKVPQEIPSDNFMMIMTAKIQAELTASNQPSDSRPEAQKPAAKGQINLPNNNKDTGNKNRPTNQFGRLQSPNVKNNLDLATHFAENAKELLEEDKENEFE